MLLKYIQLLGNLENYGAFQFFWVCKGGAIKERWYEKRNQCQKYYFVLCIHVILSNNLSTLYYFAFCKIHIYHSLSPNNCIWNKSLYESLLQFSLYICAFYSFIFYIHILESFSKNTFLCISCNHYKPWNCVCMIYHFKKIRFLVYSSTFYEYILGPYL